MPEDKRAYCEGCRNDFYNGQGAKECWSLKSAKVVSRFRLPWWTAPTTPGAFVQCTTLDCYHAPGQFAFYERLPDFAVGAKMEGK